MRKNRFRSDDGPGAHPHRKVTAPSQLFGRFRESLAWVVQGFGEFCLDANQSLALTVIAVQKPTAFRSVQGLDTIALSSLPEAVAFYTRLGSQSLAATRFDFCWSTTTY